MTTEEHLNAIVAKCRANLALAEKRTQGKWEDDGTGSLWTPWEKVSLEGYEGEHITLGKFESKDLAYIAACAGAAEAGWRATIAAIEWIQNVRGLTTTEATQYRCSVAESEIITAWPEELL